MERIGLAYFGETDWAGKASEKIRGNVQGVTDVRGLQIAVKEIEEKMRLDITVSAAIKLTPEELQNLCLTATETLQSGPTADLTAITGDPLLEIYSVVCQPAAF